jgi:hypothetical protein
MQSSGFRVSAESDYTGVGPVTSHNGRFAVDKGIQQLLALEE